MTENNPRQAKMPHFGVKRVVKPFRRAAFPEVRKLIRELWMIKDAVAQHQVRSYRDHARECRKFNDDTSIASEKPFDILQLCDEVNNNISVPLEEAYDSIRTRYEAGPPPREIQDRSIRQAIAFAVQLCYFVPLNFELRRSTQSIKEVTQKSISACTSAGPNRFLSEDFCEKNLTRKTGIKLRYTSDLTQHLELRSNKLYVFRHGSALREYTRNSRT